VCVCVCVWCVGVLVCVVCVCVGVCVVCGCVCGVWVCVVCVCVGVCGVCVCVCVDVCICGFCNVWMCVCVGFVMCGCVYVCVDFVMCGCVCVCVCHDTDSKSNTLKLPDSVILLRVAWYGRNALKMGAVDFSYTSVDSHQTTLCDIPTTGL